jgi:hypothetical protein
MNVSPLTEGVLEAMWTTKLKTGAAVLVATVAVIGGLPAQQALARKPESPATGAEAKAKPTVSADMARAEAKVAEIRELVRPQPGEHVTNMAQIAWEHDPWEAAVKAAREGKPVLAYGECAAGVPCGYG